MKIKETRYLTLTSYTNELELSEIISTYLGDNYDENISIIVLLNLETHDYIKAKEDLEGCSINNIEYVITEQTKDWSYVTKNVITDKKYFHIPGECRHCGGDINCKVEITNEVLKRINDSDKL